MWREERALLAERQAETGCTSELFPSVLNHIVKKAIRIKSLAPGQIAERLMAPKIGESVLCVCACVQLSERELTDAGHQKRENCRTNLISVKRATYASPGVLSQLSCF